MMSDAAKGGDLNDKTCGACPPRTLLRQRQCGSAGVLDMHRRKSHWICVQRGHEAVGTGEFQSGKQVPVIETKDYTGLQTQMEMGGQSIWYRFSMDCL